MYIYIYNTVLYSFIIYIYSIIQHIILHIIHLYYYHYFQTHLHTRFPGLQASEDDFDCLRSPFGPSISSHAGNVQHVQPVQPNAAAVAEAVNVWITEATSKYDAVVVVVLTLSTTFGAWL